MRDMACFLFLFFPHESERACHPERSARNARVAKDLLRFAQEEVGLTVSGGRR
jgi:hypothetical protein